MNQYEMIVLIVLIVSIGRVLVGRRNRRFERQEMLNVTPEGNDKAPSHQLREEVVQLKNRVQVLERIAVEKENSLAREIDELRNH